MFKRVLGCRCSCAQARASGRGRARLLHDGEREREREREREVAAGRAQMAPLSLPSSPPLPHTLPHTEATHLAEILKVSAMVHTQYKANDRVLLRMSACTARASAKSWMSLHPHRFSTVTLRGHFPSSIAKLSVNRHLTRCKLTNSPPAPSPPPPPPTPPPSLPERERSAWKILSGSARQ